MSSARTWRGIGQLMLLLLPAVLAGCDLLQDLPKDPEGTLDRVRGATLHAGVIHAPPWVRADEEEPSGIEAELVRHLAAELDAEVRWEQGAPDQMLALLEEHELDVLIGGFENRSPALKKVGRTRPYASTDWWVVAAEATTDTDVAGERILVEHGRAAALVARAEGVPVLGSGPARPALHAVPVVSLTPAVPRHPVHKLGTTSHVLAVPPGENAWVVAIDRSIRGLQQQQHAATAAPEAGR